MRYYLIIALYFVFSLKEALTERENETQQVSYKFMAFLYYPDEIGAGSSQAKFARSAVLIKPEWLVSSSLETNDTRLSFPRKTLVARAGATEIDANFTFNEDEDEQEREVIQIVRPTNFSSSLWWYNDITVLKTLVPFNMTATVKWTPLSANSNYVEKLCYILVYAKKYRNSSDEKMLMQMPVELSTTSSGECGIHFRKETMICASDSDDSKIAVSNPEFCENNGGGPLMCDGDIIGLQTYINNNCKQPYLYQNLSAWEDFIQCGVREKRGTHECEDICEVIDKDTPITTPKKHVTDTTLTTKVAEVVNHSNEDTSEFERLILPETAKEKSAVATEIETPTPTISPAKEITIATTETTPITVTHMKEMSTSTTETETSWPKKKLVDNLNSDEGSDKMERKFNLEAQRHDVKKKGRNSVETPVSGRVGLFYSLAIGALFF